MQTLCPFCGIQIPEPLLDGLASCQNCHRVFSSNTCNKLLSASWLHRRNKYSNVEALMFDTKLEEHEAILVYAFAEYSHDEFQRALQKIRN